jgi:hypothetical protein
MDVLCSDIDDESVTTDGVASTRDAAGVVVHRNRGRVERALSAVTPWLESHCMSGEHVTSGKRHVTVW